MEDANGLKVDTRDISEEKFSTPQSPRESKYFHTYYRFQDKRNWNKSMENQWNFLSM